MPGFGYSEPLVALSETLIRHITRTAPNTALTQGGVISGENPSAFSVADPLRLWVIQVAIVIITTQILSLLLRTMRQPRVISEVISGVILGPSIMGRIPGFSNTIFPADSLPYLTLTANIGLVLFLFLVGLETDTRVISRNAKYSVVVAAGGMILPFGLGTGVASLVYNEFVDKETVTFGHFLLFVGVAFAITAFPVLCRILTELNLLETTVGIVVLSAGVGNDIVAWVLLALAVSLVNASSGLTALWVLLSTTGFALFILFPIKWGFARLARHTGALEDGQPSAFMMTLTILLVFASAFMTDILGVHPIFGGFLAGLVIPHESGFAIALTEKLEDLVSLLFLPLYFTLSGLKTDLGLLNNGITWGYTFLIMAVAFLGKFAGASVTSRWLGFSLREAGAIGILMSCKGLVELIVLNIGLQAGILDPRVFAMFVIEALVLTFITTPLTLLVYPPKYRTLHSSAKSKKVDREAQEKQKSSAALVEGIEGITRKSRIAVMLHKLEHISPLMTMTQLLGPSLVNSLEALASKPALFSGATSQTSNTMAQSNINSAPKVEQSPAPTLDALRLMDLSDRTSAVMYGSMTVELLQRDPLVAALRTFARLHRVPVTTATLSVVPHEEFPNKICERADEVGADLVLLPWNTSLHPVVEAMAQTRHGEASSYNPFDGVFSKNSSPNNASTERSGTLGYAQFVRKVFATSSVDVALFLESDGGGFTGSEEADDDRTSTALGQHIFFPYFGGPDDRLALDLVIQLCGNAGGGLHASVVRFIKTEPEMDTSVDPSKAPTADQIEAANMLTVQSVTNAVPDTIYGPESTQHRLASETADNLAWNRFVDRSPGAALFPPDIEIALSHITFQEVSSATPLAACVEEVNNLTQREQESAKRSGSKKNVMIVVGRGRRLAAEDHHNELKTILAKGKSSSIHIAGDARKTLGDVGAAFVATGPPNASMLILQAAHRSTDV